MSHAHTRLLLFAYTSHTVSQQADRSKTTFSFFLLLHFHLYCCFLSCAVIQLDVPLINTNICILRELPLSTLHIHTWFVQTDLLDLTKQEI